jgi:hypothetical protein
VSPDRLGDGWDEYRRLVLGEITRISTALDTMNVKLERFHTDEIAQLKVDIAMLQVKSGVWGAIAGVTVALGAFFLKYMTGH